jgi:hypothetical protein
MIDINEVTEKLYKIISESQDQENIKLLLKSTLRKQCNEDLDCIYKYYNQWQRTKATSLNNLEDNDPAARLIRLLFSLIIDDIDESIRKYEI